MSESRSPSGGGLVLVIEDDEWVSRLLCAAIRDAGFDVVACSTAKSGLESAVACEPDCIICDVDLPDSDGYWVARNVRTQQSRVSVTPFLFLSGLDDQESRLQGFHVGADVYMTKPFRVDEVVAQVGALVMMATRLRERRDSMLSIPSMEGTAIEGDLAQMSVATVLTVLEMERRSGIFEVVSKKRKASLDIASGFVVLGSVGGTKVSALAALRTMLGWNVGRFSFKPVTMKETAREQKSIGAFLIEAVRLEDETARAELDMPPSRRADENKEAKLGAPALGGPPSSHDDIVPASSRAGARSPRSASEPAAPPPELPKLHIAPPPPPVAGPPPRTGLKLAAAPAATGRSIPIPPPKPAVPAAPATSPSAVGAPPRPPPVPPRPPPPRPVKPPEAEEPKKG